MPNPDPSFPARHLLLSRHGGVLSTLSVDLEGHPFGSIVPYCLDADGAPVILISDIAQHTKNLIADPRASLIVMEQSEGEIQAGGRLTCVATARRLSEPGATAERYYRYFPPSRVYHQAHAFAFWRLDPIRYRYIGGFGDIRWIEPAELGRANPFAGEAEAGIVQHMNADHGDAIRHYLELAGADAGGEVRMVGIDAEGIDLASGDRLVRVTLQPAVHTPDEARQALIALAQADALPEAQAGTPVA